MAVAKLQPDGRYHLAIGHALYPLDWNDLFQEPIGPPTEEELAAARAKGRLLGRPKGRSGEVQARRQGGGESWAFPALPSTTSSGPESSLPRLQKAKGGGAVPEGYFTRNLYRTSSSPTP